MFARVFPLTKLPRRFGFFDYRVPKTLRIQPGDLVEIPFRHRNLLGIVREVTDTSEFKRVSNISKLVEQGLCSTGDVERLEQIAKRLIQSPASIFDTTFQGINRSDGELTKYADPKSSPQVDANTAAQIQQAVSQTAPNMSQFVQVSMEGEFGLAHVLAKQSSNQTLILVPRGRLAELLIRSVHFKHAAILHGKTPLKERGAIIRAWKKGTLRVLIGTRQAALLPARNLSTVHIIGAGSDDHISVERNPRYDGRLAAELLAHQHGAALVFSGPFPRVEDFAQKRTILQDSDQKYTLVSLKAQEQSSGTAFLSEDLKKAVKTALQSQKKVLCSFNRKGVAKRLQCNACGHIPLCATCENVPTVRENDLLCLTCGAEMWIPTACPSCKEERLGKRGLGNVGIAQAFTKAFPGVKVGIIDKTNQHEDAEIQIVTEYFFTSIFQPFAQQQFGVVAELGADLQLGVNYSSAEKTAKKLHRLISIAAQQKATCIIQTWLPDVIKPLLQTETFLKQEHKTREAYHLPPVWNRYQVTCKKDAATIVPMVLQEATNQIEVLQTTENTFELLTKHPEAAQKLLAPLPDACIITPELSSYEYNERTTQSRPETP